MVKKDHIKHIEVSGNTVKEAINSALKQLGVTRDRVDIRILAEEQKGLFGMKGAKQAKIKVFLKNPNNP